MLSPGLPFGFSSPSFVIGSSLQKCLVLDCWYLCCFDWKWALFQANNSTRTASPLGYDAVKQSLFDIYCLFLIVSGRVHKANCAVASVMFLGEKQVDVDDIFLQKKPFCSHSSTMLTCHRPSLISWKRCLQFLIIQSKFIGYQYSITILVYFFS